jgi:hypothetical protein
MINFIYISKICYLEQLQFEVKHFHVKHNLIKVNKLDHIHYGLQHLLFPKQEEHQPNYIKIINTIIQQKTKIQYLL